MITVKINLTDHHVSRLLEPKQAHRWRSKREKETTINKCTTTLAVPMECGKCGLETP